MNILYFGIHDPNYARNWVLINGLRKNGVNILECRVSAKDNLRFIKLFFKYLSYIGKFNVMVVGFPGQEVMFLARLLTRKPIIFDCFTSHYGGYILDRKKAHLKSFKAKCYRFLDKWSCNMADVVLLDTQAHINFFVKEYGLPEEKFRRIWIGANDEVFKPVDNIEKQNDIFKVIFFGTYVPLQGAGYIVRAAKILEHEKDIVFYFFGKGQDQLKCTNLALELGLKNIEFIGMIKPEELRIKIAASDLVLGLFGDTPKTPLVIPNKVYEALAMKKPVITSDTTAIRELFDENDMFLVRPASPDEIANAILTLKNDSVLRVKLAENGYTKFLNNASSIKLGNKLKVIIEECLKK